MDRVPSSWKKCSDPRSEHWKHQKVNRLEQASQRHNVLVCMQVVGADNRNCAFSGHGYALTSVSGSLLLESGGVMPLGSADFLSSYKASRTRERQITTRYGIQRIKRLRHFLHCCLEVLLPPSTNQSQAVVVPACQLDGELAMEAMFKSWLGGGVWEDISTSSSGCLSCLAEKTR